MWRLTNWLKIFAPALSAHASQRGGLRRYVEGVLSDSRRERQGAVRMAANGADPIASSGVTEHLPGVSLQANGERPNRQVRPVVTSGVSGRVRLDVTPVVGRLADRNRIPGAPRPAGAPGKPQALPPFG